MAETLTDSKGRKIVVREPDVLSESQFIAMLGQQSTNMSYVYGYALPVLYTESIDGEPLDTPDTQRELDAAIKRMDRHGLQAVAVWMIARRDADTKDAAAAGAAQESAVKK